MALPVVAVDAVAGIEDELLVEEALGPDLVGDEAAGRAQPGELGRLLPLARVAGDHDQLQREVLGGGELGLDAEVGAGGRDGVAEGPQRSGDPLPLVLEPAADDPLERMEPHPKLGHDAEVAAAAAQAPEELLMAGVLGADDPLRRGRHRRAEQVVAGEAVLGGEVADAAAEGEAGDAGRADHATGGDQAVGLGRLVEVEPGGAAAGAGYPLAGVDLDRAHLGQVDDQAVVDRAVAGGVVASSPHRDLEPVLLREGERRGDVVGIDAAGDHGRAAVDQQVEGEPRLLVLGVALGQDVAVKGLA